MHASSIRSGARLARLLVAVAIRRAGAAPWLIAFGWLGLAAAQEPRMLRLFGVNLTSQASVVACFAVAVVCAHGLPTVRRMLPYLSAAIVLTASCASLFAAGVVLLEELRRAPWQPGELFLGALVQASLQLPLLIVVSLLVSTRNLLLTGVTIAVAALALSLSVRFQTGMWSTLQTIASMVLFASAAALANVHCNMKT